MFALGSWLTLGVGCASETLPDGSSGGDEAQECYSCHGTEDNFAPPPGKGGITDTSELGVGAHAVHLTDGVNRAAIECVECHIVPKAVDDPGHLEDDPSDLTFGVLASTGGLTVTWDPGTATCSNGYCHGATLKGGTGAPVWTTVDGSQTTCEGCHGNPPPPPHLQVAACHMCHSETVGADGKIDIAGGKHINGSVEPQIPECGDATGEEIYALQCAACHGLQLQGWAADPDGLGPGLAGEGLKEWWRDLTEFGSIDRYAASKMPCYPDLADEDMQWTLDYLVDGAYPDDAPDDTANKYGELCFSCHGDPVKGKGLFPALAGDGLKASWAKVIRDGIAIEGLAEMPSYPSMCDEDVAAVAAYLVDFVPGSDAPPVSSEEPKFQLPECPK